MNKTPGEHMELFFLELRFERDYMIRPDNKPSNKIAWILIKNTPTIPSHHKLSPKLKNPINRMFGKKKNSLYKEKCRRF